MTLRFSGHWLLVRLVSLVLHENETQETILYNEIMKLRRPFMLGWNRCVVMAKRGFDKCRCAFSDQWYQVRLVPLLQNGNKTS